MKSFVKKTFAATTYGWYLERWHRSGDLKVASEGEGYLSVVQVYRLNRYRYRTTNAKPLEVGVNATVGLLKEYRKFYIRPAVLIPIYQNLSGDISFDENSKLNISKWFNGIGLTVRIGKYL